MFDHLLVFILFETIQPSYNTFSELFPPAIVAASPSLSLETATIPIKKTTSIEPVIEAASFFSVDITTGMPLLTHDIFSRRPIASIEKLVTAMVILDHHTLDEKVTITKNAADQEGSTMWLSAGETMSIENLLTGMLINSANDAAVALAEYDAGSEVAFVEKMNEKIAFLDIYNTHFSNAKGFDEKNNYSTAYDTVVFGRAALSHPFIRKTVAIKKTRVDGIKAGEKLFHDLESTNELLENPDYEIIGLKTGQTPQAGESFVSLVKAPNGHEIMTVVLNSPDRFKETKIIIDWLLRNFEFP